MKKAYIFLSGELKGRNKYYRELIGGADIYCGDGGANHVYKLSLVPKEIWGEMDSVEKSILDYFESRGTVIKKFSADKDYTDGELIINYVSSMNYDEICVVGAFGGRIDHSLTNINLLFKYKNVKFVTESEEVFSVEGSVELMYPKETVVSFVPFSDTVKGLSLLGFKYPLSNHTLRRGDSTCMSNVILEDGKVVFESGKILCVVQKKQRKILKV